MPALTWTVEITWYSSDGDVVVNFYCSVSESIFTGSIIVWFGNITAHDLELLERIVRIAQRIIGVCLVLA